MRFSRIVLAYFVLGAVLFGGGAISYDDAALNSFFVKDTAEGFEANSETEGNLSNIENALGSLVGEFLGAIQLVYNLIVGMLGFLNWPIVVLATNNAPPMATLLIGGSLSVAFYMSVIRLVQSSA